MTEQPDDLVDHMPFWWCYRAWKRAGYQPTHGKLDESNPPQGGSGVPAKECPHCGKPII